MIFTQDSFRDDWYGYLTNQVSHVALGTIFTWAATVFALAVAGEFPYKAHLFLVLSGLYLFYEILYQGWAKWDTIEDWIFFSLYGVGGTVLTFDEFDKGSSLATFDISAPTLIFPIIGAHLLVGIFIRWRRASE